MDKKTFRKAAIKELQKATQRNKRYRDYQVNKKLKRILDNIEARRILFYLPMNHESNVLKTLFKYQKKGREIFVPFIVGESFNMVHLRLPLVKNSLGIKEPTNSFFRFYKIDAAVIPIIGVDATFGRVGFGKGMYDRFFARHFKRLPKIIFVQNKLCFSERIITDSHDITADYVVTPEKILYRQGTRYDSRIHNGRFRVRTSSWRRGVPGLKKA